MLDSDKETQLRIDRIYLILALVVAVAAIVRYLQYETYVSYFVTTYGSNLNIDRIGESYHRWVMDALTIYNWGVYSDFQPQPNQSIYWLPFYNAVSITAMLVQAIGRLIRHDG